MKKSWIICVVCFLIACMVMQPFSYAFENNAMNGSGENDNIWFINSSEVIIHNPYGGIDFETINHYKANLHTHTRESDGSSSPAEVIYHYHGIGSYAILAITDHNRNTWPWTQWIAEKPLEHADSSAFYPELSMLALSGNELSLGHHRGSLLNSFPFGGLFMRFSFWFIEKQNGLCLFYHPGRYDYAAEWYQRYFDYYDDCVIGIEVYNQGDRYSKDRLLWDRINKQRKPDDLIWGFSNDDMHHIKIHAFRNYQHMLMDDLTEVEFRRAMNNGSFYFSYEPEGSDADNPYYGQAMTPRLNDVDIQGNIIQISADNADTVLWYDDNSQIVGDNDYIDTSTIESNFVRAVFLNEYGKTYTQPFGISVSNQIMI